MYISSDFSCTDVFLIIGIALCPIALFILLFWFLRAFFMAVRYQIVSRQHINSNKCYRCIYYTGYEELKCTVNPYKALTKDANSCLDFESMNHSQTNTIMSVSKSNLKLSRNH